MPPSDFWLKATDPRRRSWWLAGVWLAVVLLYAPTLSYERVFDDHLQIEENLHIRSWAFIGRAFTDHVWSGQPGYPQTNSYRPLYVVWMTANYALFGEDPRGWHTTSVLLYLAAVGGVWWAAGRLLGAGFAQVTATVVFALHPTHVESVAWIASFPDALLMVFFTAALAWHLQATGWRPEQGFGPATPLDGPPAARDWRNGLSALALAGALLTKEFAVFWWPMVFCLHLAGRDGSLLARIVAAGRSLWLHALVVAAYFAARRLALPGVFEGTPYLSWTTVALTAPLVLWTYLRLLVWPVGLRLEYELTYVVSPTDSVFWLPLAGLTFLAALAGWRLRRWPLALTCFIWVWLPLLPTLNLRHFRPQEFLHDRYLFLPTLGFALLVGWGLATLTSRLASRAMQAAVAGTVTMVLGLSYAWLTAQYVPYWRNDLTLYGRILAFHPNNVFALGNLSDALLRRGRLDDGISALERAYALAPHEGRLARALGNAYCRAGRFERAVAVLEPWLTHDQESVNHAGACYDYGYALLAVGRTQAGRAYLERAAKLAPDDAQIWFMLAEARRALRLCPEADAAYAQAQRLAPDRTDVVQRWAELTRNCP
ncbi:MAG: tetratricopeptide repeat protein [Chloracidobacterium sp.]|nr:tetratricopeptide repeat protein [Chloracidobacterium sp.]MDW8218524.1 tetratricopeptide repeat protein [Acidobacteriota bacterium]